MTPHLDRFPTVEEVKANYLMDGHSFAYALVEGFSDYHPTVMKFGIGSDRHGNYVVVSCYDGFRFVASNENNPKKLQWVKLDEKK
jgi:hypothetical protein